ncbi:hypothetical protein [Neogemmobacter tilapiae]|uniref:Uncharacterized protein n=1 Tax=Neogemmobacter tilapiae TaxID=875041 RepID=A0A918WPF9_9RHOB|nr:hypothetical protein [Gemmobacter tilapiae]GHC65433.1 hypothetical protein GCM10007315_32550 [Gemmobacter tilapiae]
MVRYLKDLLEEICCDVAADFSGWEYKKGAFRKPIPNGEMLIDGGFSFTKTDTPIRPGVQIEHKPSMKLFKKIVGYWHPSSFLTFDAVADFSGKFKKEWNNAAIVLDKSTLLSSAPNAERLSHKFIDVSDAQTVIRCMLEDGLDMLSNYFVTASEDELLLNLPPKYLPKFSHDSPPGLRGSLGIAACIAHIYAGDFEFLNWYASEDCKTVVPKRTAELEKIFSALPELEKEYKIR